MPEPLTCVEERPGVAMDTGDDDGLFNEGADVCMERGAGYVKGEAVNTPARLERCRVGACSRVLELDDVIVRCRYKRLCVVEE